LKGTDGLKVYIIKKKTNVGEIYREKTDANGLKFRKYKKKNISAGRKNKLSWNVERGTTRRGCKKGGTGSQRPRNLKMDAPRSGRHKTATAKRSTKN